MSEMINPLVALSALYSLIFVFSAMAYFLGKEFQKSKLTTIKAKLLLAILILTNGFYIFSQQLFALVFLAPAIFAFFTGKYLHKKDNYYYASLALFILSLFIIPFGMG